MSMTTRNIPRTRLFRALAVASAVAAATSLAGPTTATGAASTRVRSVQPAGVAGTWHLVWRDEFSGSTLGSDWTNGWYGDGSGVSANVNGSEQACNVDKNVRVRDGALELWVTAEPQTCRGVVQPYSASLVSTMNSDTAQFLPGDVVEARILTASPDGVHIANWPAFWTDGQTWPADGEVDILEGLRDGERCWNIHNEETPDGSMSCLPGKAGQWHTYAAHRRLDGYVDFYYDGKRVGTMWLGTDAQQFVILNHSVSKYDTSYIVAPSVMKVDYVRLYR